MEKKKQKLLMTIWLSVAALSRILYFYLVQEKAVDTYAYYANASVKTGITEPVLTSGLAYAYTENLSNLLELLGGDLFWAAGIQIFFQIAWLIIVFFAVRHIWGELAGYVTGTILMVSLFVIRTVTVIEPLNFFMLHGAIVLFLFSVFQNHTAVKGWYRSNSGELFLMLTGFYMGVICTWNYIGFLLLLVMAYVLVQNQKVLAEKLWKQKNLHLEEKEQLMPIVSQGLILIAGMLVGMFSTLMKYTGLTGWTIFEQLYWWKEQFRAFPDRCQDMPVQMLVWILIAFGVGIASQVIFVIGKQKLAERKEYEEILEKEQLELKQSEKKDGVEKSDDANDIEDTEDSWADINITGDFEKLFFDIDEPESASEEQVGDAAMQDGFFTTADGRVVKYLDNPLPGPKKHKKRDMDFDIDDVNDVKPTVKSEDDFDYEIDASSDFDFN